MKHMKNKKFTASQELVDVLLKNGFTESTEKIYPDHFKRMNKTGFYNPSAVKRRFNFGHNKRHFLNLDYTTIGAYYNTMANSSDINNSLTELQLKSIIAFFKLSTAAKNKWLEKFRGNIVDLHLRYNDLISYPKWYDTVFDKQVKELFESVII